MSPDFVVQLQLQRSALGGYQDSALGPIMTADCSGQ